MDINEQDANYVQFMDCYLKGASLQDIYSPTDGGFAVRERTGAQDPVVQQRRRKSGRVQFMRLFEHTKNIVEPVDQHVGLAGKRILDFGCGTGALSIALAMKGAEVTGVDPTPVSLEACHWRARYFGCEDRFRSCQVSAAPGLPFEDGSFDLVILNSVMEFIPDQRDLYVLDFLRLIKPGGHLVISTENGLFPIDYYTRRLFPLFRRKEMVAGNLPYGVTYFELLRWMRRSPRQVENLSKRNLFNSIDKLATRKRAEGRKALATVLDGTNAAVKGACRLLGVPSDILLPYATYMFKVV